MNASGATVIVDLDREVVRSNLFAEVLLGGCKSHPFATLALLPKLAWNRASAAETASQKLDFDAGGVLYDQAMLDRLSEAKAEGKTVVAVSRLPLGWAWAIVEHLPMIDRLEHGERAMAASRSQEAPRPVQPLADTMRMALAALRPQQWSKNVLIFVPIILAHRYREPETLLAAFIAFVCFGLTASSVYLLNDLMDIAQDRRHPTKRNRPFASGRLPIAAGLALLPLTLGGAFLLAKLLPPVFMLVLGLYVTMNLAYTFYLKRKLLVDVLALASAYTLRILGGEAAATIDASFWLLAFSTFLFLSLALVKRYVELDTLAAEADDPKRVMGRGYRIGDLDMLSQLGVASAFSAVMVLALYVDGQGRMGLYKTPEFIWLVCPIVLYVMGRIWVLAKRRELPDDPVFFIIRDWRSHLMGLIVIGVMLAAKYGDFF